MNLFILLISAFDVSPDKNKIAFITRGELFVSDIEGKYVRQIETNSQGRVLEIKWLAERKTLEDWEAKQEERKLKIDKAKKKISEKAKAKKAREKAKKKAIARKKKYDKLQEKKQKKLDALKKARDEMRKKHSNMVK